MLAFETSAPRTTLQPDVITLPPLHGGEPATRLAPIQCVLRCDGKPLFDLYLSAEASRHHPIQDGLCVMQLPGGGVVTGVADAATHALGIHPEDATNVVMQALVAETRSCPSGSTWPAAVLRRLHRHLCRWMDEASSEAVCGVATSLVLIDPAGHLRSASIGDCRVLLFKPGRLLRRDRLVTLSAPVRREQRLRSALGQRRDALHIDASTATMDKGDLLILASDGGLPEAQLPELALGLRGYAADRRAGRASLAQLGEVLESQARRHLHYDDDRSLLLLERLP